MIIMIPIGDTRATPLRYGGRLTLVCSFSFDWHTSDEHILHADEISSSMDDY
jgi:hypothetical protein